MKIDMEFLILLLNSGLILLFGAADIIYDPDLAHIGYIKIASKNRLPTHISPEWYKIDLHIHATDRNLPSRGRCSIDIKVHNRTRNITLHADISYLQELEFHGITTLFKPYVRTLKPNFTTYSDEYNTWIYYFVEVIHPGSYRLDFTFELTNVDNEGIFRTSFINDKGNTTWLAALDFLPIGARRVFPCWDEPGFPAIFDIYIKYNYVDYIILSNMPLLTEIEYVLDISETVRFYSTPEIPIHHISAILLSHFTTTKIPLLEDNIDLNIRYRQQLKMNYISFANNVIDLTTSYLISLHDLENTTGITNVIIPGYYRHDAVSKLGLIYYREAAVIFDEKNDPKMRQLEIALLIGRSITYQFFRNCISNSWSYMWLNHGLTTLLALDAIDENFPEFHIKDLFVVQTLQESLRFDDDFIMKPLISDMKSPETELLSASYYLKAPSILRMLQHMLSSYVFEKGIKIYLSRNPVLEEPIDSFWTAMQSVYDASALNHRIYESSVKQLMDAWTKQQHYPIVEVTFDSHVTVSAENMNSTNEEKWWIPYTTVTNRNDKPDFSLLLIHFDLRFLSVGDDIFLPDKVETNWTIINVQQIGYYRVFYDESILNLIREYLFMHEHINKIHVLNRAQIIDDAFYFFMKNKISLRAFLELTEYLRKEKNFIAWYPMFKSLEYMSTFFHYRHSSYMKTSMMRTVNDLFVLINDDSSFSLNYLKDSLKEEISRWACVLGSSECKAEANSKLKTHLKEKNIILPWWKKWTYCNGLMIADNNTWFSALLHIDYTERSNYKIFEYLTCSENFLFIRHYIDFIESSETMNDTAKDYSQILIFHSIIARHAKNDTMLDYLLANLHKIPRKMTVTVALIDIINHVYTEEQLNKITEFIQTLNILKYTTDNSIFKHPLMDYKLYEKIRACVSIPELPQLLIFMKVNYFIKRLTLRRSQIIQQEERLQFT